MNYKMFGSTAYLYNTGSVHGVPTQSLESFTRSLRQILIDHRECKSFFSIANGHQRQSQVNFRALGFKEEKRGSLWFFKTDSKSLLKALEDSVKTCLAAPVTRAWMADGNQEINIGSIVCLDPVKNWYIYEHKPSRIGFVKSSFGDSAYDVEFLNGNVLRIGSHRLKVVKRVNLSSYHIVPNTSLKFCITVDGVFRVRSFNNKLLTNNELFYGRDDSVNEFSVNKTLNDLQQKLTSKE